MWGVLGPWAAPWPLPLVPSDLAATVPAAVAAALVPDRAPLAPPWGGWARALGHHLGLAEADAMGVAVELLARGELPGAMSLGLPAEALLQGLLHPGRLALGWPVRDRGVDVGPLLDLVALAEARARRWLDPSALSGAAFDRGARLQADSDPLLAAWLADPDLGPRLALALAGRTAALPRQLEVLHLLTGPAARAVEDSAWQRALDRAGAAASRAPALAGWVEAMAAGGRHLDGARGFKALVAATRPADTPPDAERLDRAERAAVAHLTRPGTLATTWEIQRWGVGIAPGPLVSRWFQEGLLHQCLHEAGVDRGPEIRALLAELPHELRWYALLDEADPRGADAARGFWRGIPPDSDSLGLLLQLDGLVGGLEPAKARSWLAWLRASLEPDGRIPTWFYTAPGGGPSIEGDAWQYASNDCATARATVVTGIVRAGALGEPDATLRGVLRHNAAWLADSYAEPGAPGDFYYSPPYSELCFLRLVAAWRARWPDDPLSPLLTARALRVRDRILDGQGVDGGWGSPQATACRLEGLRLWDAPADRLDRGRRALVEHQHADGSWTAEPLYLMPGKALAEIDYHASAALTSALCLRALHRSRRPCPP